MLASPLTPSFLYTYSLSMSSHECKALCIVFSFLSSVLISFLVCFRNDLTRRTMEVFIPLMRYSCRDFVSRIVLVWLKYCLIFFLSSHSSDDVHFQYKQVLVSFLFSKRSYSSWSGSILFFRYVSFFYFYYEHGTFSIQNSIPIFWLYILSVALESLILFFIFANTLKPSHVHKVMNHFLAISKLVAQRM